MKVQATRFTFIGLFTVTLLTIVTPLSFTSVWLRNITYVLTVVFSFVVARQLDNSLLKAAIKWLLITGFLFLIFSTFALSFSSRISDDWRTSSISHRKVKQKGIYICEQLLDIGALGYARRTVKVTPMTQLFNWISNIDTSRLSNDWVPVNEIYNPYSLKY